jgi:hypothetical protein
MDRSQWIFPPDPGDAESLGSWLVWVPASMAFQTRFALFQHDLESGSNS